MLNKHMEELAKKHYDLHNKMYPNEKIEMLTFEFSSALTDKSDHTTEKYRARYMKVVDEKDDEAEFFTLEFSISVVKLSKDDE